MAHIRIMSFLLMVLCAFATLLVIEIDRKRQTQSAYHASDFLVGISLATTFGTIIAGYIFVQTL